MLDNRDCSSLRSVFAAGEAAALGVDVELADLVDVRVDRASTTPEETWKRVLAEAEPLFAEVFHEAADGIVITSLEDRRILEVNDAYCRIVGYAREEVVGRTPVELGILTGIDLEDMRARVMRDEGLAGHEIAITTKTGDQRTLAVTARRVTLGGAQRALISLRDVSDRVVREQTLRTRAAEQKALAELGLRALTRAPPADLIDQAVRAVSDALNVEIVAVDELLADGDVLLRSAVGLGDRPVGVVMDSAGKGSQAGYTLLSAQPVISVDLRAERRFTPAAVLMAHGAHSSVSVAIGTPERPWGVLIAASSRRCNFTEDDIVFLDGIAHVLGIAWQREAAERELRRLGVAVEQSDDAILVIELDARIASWNRGAEQLFGYRADEVIGQRMTVLVPAARRGEELGLLARAAAGELVRVQTTRVRRDGELVSVAITISPIRDTDGAVSAALLIARDITHLKRAEQELARLAQAAELSTDAIISVDLDGLVRHWSAGAERLLGISAKDVIGRPLDEVDALAIEPEAATERQRSVSARALNGEFPVEHEFQARRTDGKILDLVGRAAPWRVDEHVVGITRIASDITEPKNAERELRRLADAVELGTGAVISIDLEARVRHWNPGAERLFGYSADEAVGRSLYELTVFTDEPRDQIARMLAGEPAYQYETRRRRKDGTVIDVLLTVSPWTVDGRVVGATGIAINLTERKQAERERERLAAAAEFATDAIVSTDRDGVVRHWNAGAARLYGYRPEEAVGRQLWELTIGVKEAATQIEKVLAGERVQHEAQRTRKDGTVIDVLTTLSPWIVDGEIVGITGVSIDLTERKKLENGLQYLADHDPLTSLYSRRRFTDELERQLRLAARSKHPPALVLFDLDQLKAVNDTHGHAAGDALLKAFAEVLRSRARATDIVARLGGDEFALILPEAGKSDALRIARDIRALLRASWAASSISVSAGIVILTGHEQITADEMLVCGDTALYEAKEHGGDQARIYSGQVDGVLNWVKRIHAALTDNRLVLHSQPIIDLRTGQVTHRELLIRMLGDDGELIAPDRFIPTAERFGLIGEIDRWVTNAGLRLALNGTPVAINLSGYSIGDEAIIAATHAAVAQGLQPNTVIFEITETAALRNLPAARAFAATLAGDGCAVALDDFGTGFGSFIYLKHIPARYLKIDVDFVRELTTSNTDQEVVKAIVGIARSLGKQTIAEGVENTETLALLSEYGVDYAQGFQIAKPGPLDQR
ncbi:MAG: PAS domain S-box protein [Solirubrobacteraceae bacterium]